MEDPSFDFEIDIIMLTNLVAQMITEDFADNYDYHKVYQVI